MILYILYILSEKYNIPVQKGHSLSSSSNLLHQKLLKMNGLINEMLYIIAYLKKKGKKYIEFLEF